MKAYILSHYPQIITVVVFVLIFLSLFYRITYFNFYMFDEVYYADAAREMYLNENESNFQHPPLAKWLISVPYYVMGYTWALSWRLAPIVFGFLGLVVLYFFAKKIDLNWWQRLITVLCLLGSVSWYVLSRTAMLDIFLSFFVLISAYVFYIFLSKNNFSRNYDSYSHLKYLVLAGVLTGFAGACKWSGFYVFIFYFFFFHFYSEGSKRRRMIHFALIILISVYTYFTLSLLIYRFNYMDVAFRNFQDIIFHNSAMLPENNPNGVKEMNLVGGYKAFLRYFLQNEVYIVSSPYMARYGLVNNQFLAATLIGFTLYFLLAGVGLLIRKYQRIEIELPVFFKEKSMLFMYFYGFSLLLPWLVIARVQYSFYYVPAFPFIILLGCFYLFKYCNWKLQILFFLGYFAFALYWLPVAIPLN